MGETTRARCAQLHLTEAEQHVAFALVGGLSYGEIAALRSTAPSTVANQVAAIYRKTGARSRTELAARLYPVAAPALTVEERLALLFPELTQAERHVVGAVALGNTNKWVAYELAVSESTVASHLRRAMIKLQVRHRVQVARLLFDRCCTPKANATGEGTR